MPVNTNGITSEFVKTMTSFSGSDINIVLGSTLLGNAGGISYSLTREKSPVFVLGNPSPVSFSRGKRGIAGSLELTIFDRSGFKTIMENSQYVSKLWDVTGGGESYEYNDGNWTGLQTGNTFPTANQPTATAGEAISGYTGAELRTPNYPDQLPPFDLSITARNEVGTASSMVIYGCEIVNHGSSHGLSDIVFTGNYTWVARELIGLTPSPENSTATDQVATEFATLAGPDTTVGR